MVAAVLAAIAIAFTVTGFTVVDTASAASADEASVMAPMCSGGKGTDGRTGLSFAWASCDWPPAPRMYEFRVDWSCTGENYWRHSAWDWADGARSYGYCAAGKTVDQYGYTYR